MKPEVEVAVQQETAVAVRTSTVVALTSLILASATIMGGYFAMFVSPGQGGGGGGGTVPMKAKQITAAAWVSGSWHLPSEIVIYGFRPQGGTERLGTLYSSYPFQPGPSMNAQGAIFVKVAGFHNRVVISMKREDGKFLTACISANSDDTKNYYINYNGDTYYDQALTEKAGTCDRVTSDARIVEQVTNAVVNEPYTGLAGTTMRITRDRRQAMGMFDMENNVYISAAPQLPAVPFTTPLQVDIQHDNNFAVTVPARYMTIYDGMSQTPNQFTICIPETVVGGTTIHPPQDSSWIASYFYDKLGNPHVDSHLKNPVPCTPIIPVPDAAQKGDEVTPPTDE